MPNFRELIEEYKSKKKYIKRRLKEFSDIDKGKNKEIFPELCFCILTPQSNARHCDKAIQELKKRNLLFTGRVGAIRRILKGRSRFHNKKAGYIVNARRLFNGKWGQRPFFALYLKNGRCPHFLRNDLVKTIKGIGYKEASHFLRNIGLGADVAILDRHILKNLKIYGIINEVPSSLTPKMYLDIEDKARRFSKRVRIPLEELDLLFWSKETGEIFK